jgi:hypothetical protein
MTTEERLERVEKELVKAKRRSRVVLVAAVMAVAVVFLLGAGNGTVQNVIRAGKFELVDASGTVRAALGSDSAGRSALAFGNEKNPRIVLALDSAGGSALVLCDQNGKGRVLLALSGSGEPDLELYDQNDTSRVMLGLDTSGPMLYLCDQNGKIIWRAP